MKTKFKHNGVSVALDLIIPVECGQFINFFGTVLKVWDITGNVVTLGNLTKGEHFSVLKGEQSVVYLMVAEQVINTYNLEA